MTQTKPKPDAAALLAELQSIPATIERIAAEGDSEPIVVLKMRQAVLPYELAVQLAKNAKELEPLVIAAVVKAQQVCADVRGEIAEITNRLKQCESQLPALEVAHQHAQQASGEYSLLRDRLGVLLRETAVNPGPEQIQALGSIAARLPELKASMTAAVERQ